MILKKIGFMCFHHLQRSHFEDYYLKVLLELSNNKFSKSLYFFFKYADVGATLL